jgi:hypothetical protein
MRTLPPREVWQAVGAQLARLALLMLTVGVVGVGMAAVAVAMQAQRDETRSADVLLVIAPELPPTSLIEYSLDLYRRGYGVRIALAGPGRERAYADLLGRGLPVEALVGITQSDSLDAALATARQDSAHSLLVVSSPSSQLLSLKIARDLGLRAYGSPVPTLPLEPLDTLRAALGYWRYALFGEA